MEDSRKGMPTEGTLPVMARVVGAWRARCAGHGGLYKTGVLPRTYRYNWERSCLGEGALGAKDILSAH